MNDQVALPLPADSESSERSDHERLRIACRAGDFVAARELIDQGVNPFVEFDAEAPKDTSMYTAISWSPELAYELLEDPKVLERATQDDLNDFLFCSVMVDPRCMLLAISKGADADWVIGERTWHEDGEVGTAMKQLMRHPMHAAAAVGYADLVLKLLEAGFDLGAICPDRQRTPAQLAAQAGHDHVVRVLGAWAAREEAVKTLGEFSRVLSSEMARP